MSLYAFWRHQLAWALTIMLVPPPIASLLIMRFADLEPYRRSRFGHYVARHMTRAAEVARLAGATIMAVGAWYRSLVGIVAGIAIVLLAWLRGILIPKP